MPSSFIIVMRLLDKCSFLLLFFFGGGGVVAMTDPSTQR